MTRHGMVWYDMLCYVTMFYGGKCKPIRRHVAKGSCEGFVQGRGARAPRSVWAVRRLAGLLVRGGVLGRPKELAKTIANN